MVTTARVRLWGQTVGAVVWNDVRNVAEFEFDRDFLRTGLNVAPIAMPLEKARSGSPVFSFPQLNEETFRGLPGLLADSLPDSFGDDVMATWLARQGRNLESLDPVERLCYTGRRGMGALEFEPTQAPFEKEGETLHMEQLVQLAEKVLQKRDGLATNMKDEEAMLDILRVGTSAGGARAKGIVAFNETTDEVRSGQVDGLDGFSYWIIKFDGVQSKSLNDPKGYGRIEYAYYLMAKEAGIEMMPCRLLEEGGRAHFMTKRFDRLFDKASGKTEKLHMQTLCGMAHFDYNDPSSYSYEQAFQIMRQLRLPYADAEQLFRRMCFNVMARNQDDHTKNISFLMDEDGVWRLSPAYDMTYAFDPSSKWLKAHQMSVNGKRNGIDKHDLLDVATRMNIKKASKVIAEVRSALQNWPNHAKVPENWIRQISEAFST